MRIGLIIVLVLLLCSLQVGFANSHNPGLISYTEPQTVPTEWLSPDGLPEPIHEVPHYFGPLIIKECSPPKCYPSMRPASTIGRVAVVVHSAIYNDISESLHDYQRDLLGAGFMPVVYQFTNGTPEELRAYLAQLYNSPEGLVGAILIGNIPYIIYEMMQENGYVSFPCDIFYMDLDGEWLDTLTDGSVKPNNGKYDTRSGNLDLEIWVGRIWTHNLTELGAETDLINSYLGRTRNYRQGINVTNAQALVYIDDDWADMLDDDINAVKMVFSEESIEGVNHPELTNAEDYQRRLKVSTRWYHVRSHGESRCNGFYQNRKQNFVYVCNSDYRRINPRVSFYSLFGCAGCKYTTSDYLAGTIAFNSRTPGLFVIGSTKRGGMWNDIHFYTALSEGHCLGESFRIWFNTVQYYENAPRWWYGMTMVGDPTLHPNPASFTPYYTLTAGANPKDGGLVTPRAGTVEVYPSGLTVPVSAEDKPGYYFVRWEGPVEDPYSAETRVTITSNIHLVAHFTERTLNQVKALPVGTHTTIINRPVSMSEPDNYFIEEPDRSCGLRFYAPLHSLHPGMLALAGGIMCEDPETGERYIHADRARRVGWCTPIAPIAMTCRSLGGEDWKCDSAGGVGQVGVTGGRGANNMGMLVTICGRVSDLHEYNRTFYISDGSTKDRIRVSMPFRLFPMPKNNQFVSVTGAVTCEKVGDKVVPLILSGEAAIAR